MQAGIQLASHHIQDLHITHIQALSRRPSLPNLTSQPCAETTANQCPKPSTPTRQPTKQRHNHRTSNERSTDNNKHTASSRRHHNAMTNQFNSTQLVSSEQPHRRETRSQHNKTKLNSTRRRTIQRTNDPLLNQSINQKAQHRTQNLARVKHSAHQPVC